jgi:hypothetical protein
MSAIIWQLVKREFPKKIGRTATSGGNEGHRGIESGK